MSKNMIFLVLGILAAWFVIGIFTKDFSIDYLIYLFFGVFLGYTVGKKEAEPKE
ncbi:hypothetical protein [Sporosarcina sp.]|uniref:hypothetical protein n=1 Tax=Sporosarcina sp. TaxID=49982 RepID=UPI00260899DE|nr:hypothetical protein [Sporosarcina sp.]